MPISSYSSFDRPSVDYPEPTDVGEEKLACVEYTEPRTRIFDIIIGAAKSIQRKEFKVLKLCSPNRNMISGLPPRSGEGASSRRSSRLRIIFDILPSGTVTNARYYKSDHEAYFGSRDNKLTRHSLEAVKNFVFAPQTDESGTPRKTENVIMTFKYYG